VPWGVAAAGVAAAGSIGAAAISNSKNKGGAGGSYQPFKEVNTPLFTTSVRGQGAYDTLLTPKFDQLMAQFRGSADKQIASYDGLMSQVAPGTGRLTEATRQIFANARSRLTDAKNAATSDLRGNLESRRVLGSSFATDTMARAEAEFAKAENELTDAENEAQARNVLFELEKTTQFIDKMAATDQNAILAEINELNLIGGQSAALASQATGAIAANNQLMTQLAAQSAAGQGQLFGLLGGSFGTKLMDMFNKSQPGTPTSTSGTNPFAGGAVGWINPDTGMTFAG
jgi:hypothetical protein